MDQPNTPTPLKEGLNAQTVAQTPEPSQKPRKIKPIYIILVVVILLLVCGGISGGIYLFLRQAQDKGETEDQETSEQEDEEESDPYEGWETYTNTTYEYSLKYPSDWELNTETAECSDCVDATLLISKGDYKFQINVWVMGREGKVCIFSDDEDKEDIKSKDLGESVYVLDEGITYKNMGDGEELSSSIEDEVFRRNKNIFTGDQSFIVCGKVGDSGTYQIPASVGEIIYQTPSSVDQSYLDLLDKIFASLERESSQTTGSDEGLKTYTNTDPSFTLEVPSDWETVNNVSGYTCTPRISAEDELGFLVEFHDENDQVPFVIYSSNYGCVIHDECLPLSTLTEMSELKYFYNTEKSLGSGYICKVNGEEEYYTATISPLVDIVFTLEGDANLMSKDEFSNLVLTFKSDTIDAMEL